LVGEKVDEVYLQELTSKAEELINRKIKYLILNQVELKKYKQQINDDLFVVWCK
jgi:hypothetical protein